MIETTETETRAKEATAMTSRLPAEITTTTIIETKTINKRKTKTIITTTNNAS